MLELFWSKNCNKMQLGKCSECKYFAACNSYSLIIIEIKDLIQNINFLKENTFTTIGDFVNEQYEQGRENVFNRGQTEDEIKAIHKILMKECNIAYIPNSIKKIIRPQLNDLITNCKRMSFGDYYGESMGYLILKELKEIAFTLSEQENAFLLSHNLSVIWKIENDTKENDFYNLEYKQIGSLNKPLEEYVNYVGGIQCVDSIAVLIPRTKIIEELKDKVVVEGIKVDPVTRPPQEMASLWAQMKVEKIKKIKLLSLKETAEENAEASMIENWINLVEEFEELSPIVMEEKEKFIAKKKNQIRGFVKQGLNKVNLAKTLIWENIQ